LKKGLESIFGITNIKIAKDDKFPALRVSNTLNGIINEFGDPKESPFLLILAGWGSGSPRVRYTWGFLIVSHVT
jgi:hypothetical protein